MITATPIALRAPARTLVLTEGLVQNYGAVISSQAIFTRAQPWQSPVVTKELRLRTAAGPIVVRETGRHLTVSLLKSDTLLYEANETTLTLPAINARVAEDLARRHGQDVIEGARAIGIRAQATQQVLHTDGTTTVYDGDGSYHWDGARLTGVAHAAGADSVYVEGAFSSDGQDWVFPTHAVRPFISRLT
ncbi:MAG TPA: hypothetical protein VGO93_12255 [Candidatus Xenobia bacterium]|jgi:hypothetical protein